MSRGGLGVYTFIGQPISAVQACDREGLKETLEESLPYMNLKFVLVEEGGQLKVGHFEIMPPSMLD